MTILRIEGPTEVAIRGVADPALYIVARGDVEAIWVTAKRRMPLRSFGVGDVFGESTLFERQPWPATYRAEARTTFAKGEEARQAGKTPEAVDSYSATIRNRYADPGTRQKAREQLALVDPSAPANASPRELYLAAPSLQLRRARPGEIPAAAAEGAARKAGAWQVPPGSEPVRLRGR